MDTHEDILNILGEGPLPQPTSKSALAVLFTYAQHLLLRVLTIWTKGGEWGGVSLAALDMLLERP